MLPQVLRPARFNTPVAAFALDGLGICHFNRNANPREWQVAFLRKGHRLTIGIKTVDQEGRIVEPVIPPTPVGTEIRHLRWVVSDPSDVHLGEGEFPDGFFKDPKFPNHDKRTLDDNYDYRWVLDVLGEVPHQFNRLLRIGEGDRRPEDLVTIVSIPLALFYTRRVAPDSVILALQDQTPQQGFVLGRTNELVGAALYSTQAGATLRLVDVATGLTLPNFPTLPAAPGRLYEISIFNLDERARGEAGDQPRTAIQNYVAGDLELYYAVMDVPPAMRHRLFAPSRSGARALDGDCHLGGAGHIGARLPDFDLTTLIQQP